MTEKTTNKKKLVIISSICAAMIILLVTLLCSCKGNTNTEKTAKSDEIVGTSIQTVTEIVADEQGSTQVQEVTEVVNIKADGTVEKSEDVTKPTEKKINDDNSVKSQANNSSASNSNVQTNNTSNNNSPKVENQNKPQNNKPNTNSNTNSNSDSSSATSKPSSNSSTTSATAKPTTPTTSSTTSKVWHEAVYEYIEHPAITEQVWVVDKEAYTYEETIYEKHARTICNTCGEDITDCCGEHGYNHMINGENASYRSELRKIAVGTQTVSVPEQGHYETRIVKEAYTEKKLVKEAGYY